MRGNFIFKKRKGQFFMLGAIIFASFIAMLSFTGGDIVISGTETKDLSQNMERSLDEFMRSSNIAFERNGDSQYINKDLRTTARFQEYLSETQAKNYRSYFLFGVPDQEDLNVSFVNLYDRDIEVNVSLSDSSRELGKINQRQDKSTTFNSVPQNFDVEINISSSNNSKRHQFSTSKKFFVLYHLELETENQQWVGTRIG